MQHNRVHNRIKPWIYKSTHLIKLLRFHISLCLIVVEREIHICHDIYSFLTQSTLRSLEGGNQETVDLKKILKTLFARLLVLTLVPGK